MVINIKKILIVVFLLTNLVNVNAKEPEYKDMYDSIITLLYPYIDEEVKNYYGEFKQYDLFNIELNIDRLDNYTFDILVKLKTFEHAHNPPYGNDTITFRISLDGVETLDYLHVGDEYEKIIKDFTDELVLDIKETFNLDLTGYEQYTFDQFYYLSSKDKYYDGLKEISLNIAKDILNNDYNLKEHQGKKNFINPVIFINEDEAIIMFKRSSGMNVVYKVKKENDKWVIYENLSKMGKIMEYKLLWYM